MPFSCSICHTNFFICHKKLVLKKVSFNHQVFPCDSGPCENGGECSNVGDYFECKCPSGYSGKQCQNKGMKKLCFS